MVRVTFTKDLPHLAQDHKPSQLVPSYFIIFRGVYYHFVNLFVGSAAHPLALLAWQTPALCEGQRQHEAPGGRLFHAPKKPWLPAEDPTKSNRLELMV